MKVLIAVFGILALLFQSVSYADSDKYESFSKMSASEREGIDFAVVTKDTSSGVLIMAIHGGKIEGGTDQLAGLIADRGNYDSYVFKAMKKANNQDLHVTSTRYDEPRALEMTSKATLTVSIHGFSGTTSETIVGGRDQSKAAIVKKHLSASGFRIKDTAKFNGDDPTNIVNRNLNEKGIQLELSSAQRKAFSEAHVLKKYAQAINDALEECETSRNPAFDTPPLAADPVGEAVRAPDDEKITGSEMIESEISKKTASITNEIPASRLNGKWTFMQLIFRIIIIVI